LTFGCVASSKSSSSLSLPLSSHTLKIHPLTSAALSRSPSQLPHPSASYHCPDIVITYTNRFFYETAIGLKQAIEEVSLRSTSVMTISVWPDMNLALLLPLEHCPHSPLQISIAPHEDTPLLRRYIVFHLEQSWSIFMQSVRYLTLLREAQAVWTFTAQQTALLSSFGVDPQKIWCLPVYTDRRYLLATYQTFNTQETDPSQDKEGDDAGESGGHQYDILIFGSSSARRLRFVEEFSRNASLFSLPISFFRLMSGPQYSLMGKRRDRYVRRSKV
jgi:hypothetical protein